uniref:Single domain-containing protein n=1 Tax=Amblyomma maculatum TaxID=34609 RepID=G3MTE0_AMBMU
MHTLLLCLAIFLTLAVIYCDGKKNGGKSKGNCEYGDRTIPNGQSRNLQNPCVKVKCNDGTPTVTECPGASVKLEERRRGKRSGKRKEGVFPQCCEEDSS